MMALVVPETEVPFMLASLQIARRAYEASGNESAIRRIKKLNAELLHQSGIEPPSLYHAFLDQTE